MPGRTVPSIFRGCSIANPSRGRLHCAVLYTCLSVRRQTHGVKCKADSEAFADALGLATDQIRCCGTGRLVGSKDWARSGKIPLDTERAASGDSKSAYKPRSPVRRKYLENVPWNTIGLHGKADIAASVGCKTSVTVAVIQLITARSEERRALRGGVHRIR
jgi:hypothetical protein